MKQAVIKVFQKAVPGFTVEFCKEISNNEFFIIAQGQAIKSNFRATFSEVDGWFIDAINHFSDEN